ncbi:unnamed protein product, partial [Ectocarpus sp. 12 AP-2014]
SCSSWAAAGAAASAAGVAHVPRPGLIRFLYERCLFPPASREPPPPRPPPPAGGNGRPVAAAAASAAAAAAVAESSLGPRCKKRESRRAAFALLSALCRGNEAHLRQAFVLLGGRDLVTKGFLDSDMDSGNLGSEDGSASDSSVVAVADGSRGASHGVATVVGDGAAEAAAAAAAAAAEPVPVPPSTPVVTLEDASGGAGVRSGEPWDYDPTSVLKESGQHVGLQNQGATCYMNSLLQQLYHVQDFSLQLLGLVPDRRAGGGESSYPLQEEDEVLLQLQVLFASLRISQRKFYDTKPFCAVFMDYDGQPLRHAEQKDVNEFCTHLLHKLEGSSKQAGSLIDKVFGGTLAYQVISRDCEHTSERTEPFIVLTAEVQDKESLEGSLQLLVAGEMLTGDNCYLCEKCGQRVTAQRRCAIKQLPSTLIVHLKRFEFDLGTMRRHKLNHRCSFPMELDMAPWTLENLQRQHGGGRLSGGSEGRGTAEAATAAAAAVASEAVTGSSAPTAAEGNAGPGFFSGDSGTRQDSIAAVDSTAAVEATSPSDDAAAAAAGVEAGDGGSGGGEREKKEEEGKEAEAPVAAASGGGGGGGRTDGDDSEGPRSPPPVDRKPLWHPEGGVEAVTAAGEGVDGDERPSSSSLQHAAGAREGSEAFGGGGGGDGAGGGCGSSTRRADTLSGRTEYRLKGIVAHQGTADHGHYYSLIRAGGDRWLEFNDRRVTPYDPANIPRDCFGGALTPQEGGALDASAAAGGGGSLHETSAYLLLYEQTAGSNDRHNRDLDHHPSTVPPSSTSWRENTTHKDGNQAAANSSSAPPATPTRPQHLAGSGAAAASSMPAAAAAAAAASLSSSILTPRSYTSCGEASAGTGVVVAPGPAGGDPDKSLDRKEEERDDVAAGFGVVRGNGGGDGALAEAALDPGGR